MEIHVTDDRIGRYFRRRQLGLRLLSHDAPAKTIRRWSGLTRDQLLTLRRRWAIPARDRSSGRPPSSFGVFFTSARKRGQAALFAALCQAKGVISAQRGKDTADGLPSVESGERLCEAYELFKVWAPNATLDFAKAELLLIGVAEENAIELTHCEECNSALLIDRLGKSRSKCAYCKKQANVARPAKHR